MSWFKKNKISQNLSVKGTQFEMLVKIKSIYVYSSSDKTLQIEILQHPFSNKPFFSKSVMCKNDDLFYKISTLFVVNKITDITLTFNLDFDKENTPKFIIVDCLTIPS